MKVLVVDDSRAMRMIIARELRKSVGVDDVVEADNPAAAVGVLQEQAVDLVLSDWNMPGMNGLDFLRLLRAEGWNGLFGFITSESAPSTRQTALGAGAAFLITKPFSGDQLADQIAIARGGSASRVEQSSASSGDQAGAVADVLRGMLRKDVTVAAADGPPPREVPRVVARYVDSAGRDAAVCIAEVPLAAAAGAALSMMPPASAGEWSDSGVLPEAVAQNFYEVANVLASVVGGPDERFVLAGLTTYADFERLPDEERLATAVGLLHLQVAVSGYGSGRLTLATLSN